MGIRRRWKQCKQRLGGRCWRLKQSGQPLSQLAERARGVVCCFDSEHREACRLREMGLCAGCCVQMVQSGDPVILDVDGSRMAISRELAHQIMVTPHAA